MICVHTYNGVTNEAIVLHWPVWTTWWDFKKQWAGALLIVKCCCFVQKWLLVTQFWTSLSEEEEKERIGCLATFWFNTFAVLFCATRHVVDHENTWRRMVCCIIIYYVSALSLHIESTDSMILWKWTDFHEGGSNMLPLPCSSDYCPAIGTMFDKYFRSCYNFLKRQFTMISCMQVRKPSPTWKSSDFCQMHLVILNHSMIPKVGGVN